MVRKLISEFVGTMLLVLFGCGIAVVVNSYVYSIYQVALPFTMLIIALGFGFVITAIVYTFGDISGAHVNPAVSIAMAIDKRIGIIECLEYIAVQILGGIVGAEILGLILGGYETLGANGYATLSPLPNTTTLGVAFLVEFILTFVFVLVVLTVTAKKDNKTNGIIIGLTLALVHMMGIPFTGTSVNPARSIGPAIFVRGEYLNQLWVFILAPILGGLLSAIFYEFVIKEKEEITKELPAKAEDKKINITEEKKEIVVKNVKKTTKPVSKEKVEKKPVPKKEPVKKSTRVTKKDK